MCCSSSETALLVYCHIVFNIYAVALKQHLACTGKKAIANSMRADLIMIVYVAGSQVTLRIASAIELVDISA